jgi:16S rRNA (cytosine967-C5)-methyltransferase
MRLGGRLAAAIEVLEDIERRHRPAADALKDWGLSHRFAGAGDRGAIGNIVYDALRRKRSASFILDAETARAQAFGALLLEWKETPAELNAALDGDRFAPTPLDIRVNELKASREKVLAELSGMQAAPTRIAAHGIRIPPIDGAGRHPNVQAEPAFQKGWFEVQDEGSQVAAALVGAEAGIQLLDYCAGAGGKTLALSADMQNRGQIFAFDSEKQRLAPIFDRLRRADSRNVQVLSKPAELSALEGHMDVVLVDAPCTGSGTWRRRPDAKWRLTARQLDGRRAEQAAILDAASRYVKPGGLLAYVTCSVFREENHEQVEAFLGRTSGFAAADHAALWRERFPSNPEAARVEGQGITLTPATSGTDGFFFAALRRVT